MSCLQSFDDMCRKIVCPTRHHINERDMIERKFRTKNVKYQLHKIPSQNGLTLSAIVFERDFDKFPTVLYLHGNGGHKLQCLQLVGRDINLVSFDFSGCGKSQGQFLTYGERQAKDISLIISFIQINYKQPKLKFALWGRSMGASLALLYASLEPMNIFCMILDSPFQSLSKVIQNVAESNKKLLPKFIISFAIYMIKRKVQTIAGMQIFNCDYLEHLNHLNQISEIPLLFCYSKNDSVVTMDDVVSLYENYQGPKLIYEIQALHHEDRPKHFIQYGMDFIENPKLNEQNAKFWYSSTMTSKKGISLCPKRIIKRVIV